jgi:glutaredoxin
MFAIYSKSGCPDCLKVKRYLIDQKTQFTEINCDEELFNNRDEFIQSLEKIANQSIQRFPIVFHNEQYIGGYNETVQYIMNIMKQLDFYSTDF